MSVIDLAFPSATGDARIHASIYLPVAVRTRALVLFAHDITEHHRRHLSLITRLTEAGYAVAALDMPGHGLTAEPNDSWGRASASGDDIVDDVRRLAARAMRRVPDVPLLLFGHGWGSLALRASMPSAAGQVSGAVFSGTYAAVPGLRDAYAHVLGEVQASGAESATSALEVVFQAFSARVGGRSPLDWRTANDTLRASLEADPLCRPASEMSAGLVAGFLDLALRVNSDEWAEDVPRGVPTLFLSGDRDAAGDFGAGVYAAANTLVDAGCRTVRTQLLTDARHDLLHEPAVAEGVIDFFNEALAITSGKRIRRR